MHSASPQTPPFSPIAAKFALARAVHPRSAIVDDSSTVSRLYSGNCVDGVVFRLAFTGVLLVGGVGVGCARPSTVSLATGGAAAHALVSEGDEATAPTIQRARVSVAETTSATIAPVRDLAADDDDDFDEMPFVRAPSIEELGDVNAVKRALRLLRWIAPSSESSPPRRERPRAD